LRFFKTFAELARTGKAICKFLVKNSSFVIIFSEILRESDENGVKITTMNVAENVYNCAQIKVLHFRNTFSNENMTIQSSTVKIASWARLSPRAVRCAAR